MYRVIEGIVEKNYDATKTAKTAMVMGMGVIKDGNNVKFPTSTTAKNIFFVGKELIGTGLDSMRELSDYDLENIAEGEFVYLDKPIIGEQYWTNQTTGAINVGDYVAVNNAGKFVKVVPATTASNLLVVSTTMKDAGTHEGITIEVVDWATA